MGFHDVPGGLLFAWPTGKLIDPPLTPREAWVALLAGEIEADDFGRVLIEWEAAWQGT